MDLPDYTADEQLDDLPYVLSEAEELLSEESDIDTAELDDDLDEDLDENLDEDLDEDLDLNGPESDLIGGRFASQEDLLNAYTNLEQMIGAEQAAYQDVRGRLEGLENVLRSQQQMAENEIFREQLREQYEKDPLETIQMMILESKKQHWDAMEDRIRGLSDAFQASQAVNYGARSIGETLADPRYADLRPYAGHLEHLVAERGMSPGEAFELLKSVEDNLIDNFEKRTAAARDVRNRSTMESVGGSAAADESDGDLDRVLKKSKTLDEMFDGLSRIKL